MEPEEKQEVVREQTPIGSWDYRPVTSEVRSLVFGDRGEAYGHPLPEGRQIAALWTAYKGVEFTPHDYPIMMMLVKIARESNAHRRDNCVDLAGYAEVLERQHEAVAFEGRQREASRGLMEALIGGLRGVVEASGGTIQSIRLNGEDLAAAQAEAAR